MIEKKVKVLLADDHTMFRQGIGEMLSTEDRIEVVGEAENGREAIDSVKELRPDVVLLDLEMPVMNARQAIGSMLGVPGPPKVVIVTMYDDPRLVRELIGLGAVAYLVKSATIEDLISAVLNAAQSRLGPDENFIMVTYPETLEGCGKTNVISERELEVLLLVSRGMSNQQIAASLHISEATVKRHLANIYPKMAVSSRGAAVRKALRENWITAEDITAEEQDGRDGAR